LGLNRWKKFPVLVFKNLFSPLPQELERRNKTFSLREKNQRSSFSNHRQKVEKDDFSSSEKDLIGKSFCRNFSKKKFFKRFFSIWFISFKFS